MSVNIKISSKSSTPKYEQLVNDIISHIRVKTLQPGENYASIFHNSDSGIYKVHRKALQYIFLFRKSL